MSKQRNPGIIDFTNQVVIYADGIMTIISVSLKTGVIESISREEIHSLHFRFETVYKQNEVTPLPSLGEYKEQAPRLGQG